jgi:hypothetical protein
MAGTLVTDRIESDASYPSSINIASPVIVSNTFAFPAGTVSAPAFFPTGDTNTGIYFPAADTIAFTEGGVEAMRINSSGRLLLGTTTDSKNLAFTQDKELIVVSGFSSQGGLSMTGYVGNGSTGVSPKLTFQRSIGSTDGSMTALTNDGTWRLGEILFRGSDGTDFQTAGAIDCISALSNFSASNSPGILRFLTTGSSSVSLTERARITNNGTLSLQGPHSGAFINCTNAVSVASGGTITVTATNAGAVLVMVWNNTEGTGLICFGSFAGTMTKLAGTGEATDTGSTHAIYKSDGSNTITYKNKYGGTRNVWIAVYSALAIA